MAPLGSHTTINSPVRLIKGMMLFVGIVGVIVFVYFRMKPLISGPKITLAEPFPGQTYTDNGAIHVRGSAQNTTSLTLNDYTIFIDEDGQFDEPLLLSPGYNIITLQATDRFEKTRLTTLALFFEHNDPVIENPPEQPAHQESLSAPLPDNLEDPLL